jgi:hypothetical protein
VPRMCIGQSQRNAPMLASWVGKPKSQPCRKQRCSISQHHVSHVIVTEHKRAMTLWFHYSGLGIRMRVSPPRSVKVPKLT